MISRFILTVCASFFSSFIVAQELSFQKIPGKFQRSDADITSVIPFEDGLLSIAIDRKGFAGKCEVRLCKINNDLEITKSIDIGFAGEKFMNMIGLYRIENKPVIFYHTYNSGSRVMNVKAIVINPETLKMETLKEVVSFTPEYDDYALYDMKNEDAGWLSPVKIKLSQDSTRYLLTYNYYEITPVFKAENKESCLAVIDKDANLLFKKVERFPKGAGFVKILDFCLVDDKIITFFNVADSRVAYEYTSKYVTTVRSTDIKTSKSTDVKLSKEIGFIRNARFLYKDKRSPKLHIVGTFSNEFNEQEISGGLHLIYNSTDGAVSLITKKELPYELKLSSLYSEYYLEKRNEPGLNDPLYNRLKIEYCGWRNDDVIDVAVEYIASGTLRISDRSGNYPAFILFTSIINMSFSGGEITFSTIEKKQMPNQPERQNVSSFGAFPFGDKLIVLYNDNEANLRENKSPRIFDPMTKEPSILVAAIIDEKGNVVKREIARNEDRVFPEPAKACSLNKNTILLRMANPITRYKEISLAAFTFE